MERTRVDKIAREIGCIERQMEVEEKGLHTKISATSFRAVSASSLLD